MAKSTFREDSIDGNRISKLPFDEEVWLTVSVTSVRQGRTQQGEPFRDVPRRSLDR
jgi:hypothetical protein